MKARLPRVLNFPVPLWLSGFGAIVAWLGGSVSDYETTKQRSPQQDRSSSVESRPASTVTERTARSSEATGPSANPSEGASGIAAAAALVPGLERLEAFQQALQGINASNWQEAAEATRRAYEEGLIAEMEEGWIYQRIGQVAGPVAIKYFEPEDMASRESRRGQLSTLRGWAAEDPAAAWAYLESLPESPFRSFSTAGFIRAAVEKDLTLARHALDSLSPEAQVNFFTREWKAGFPGTFASLAESWLKESTPQDPAKGFGAQNAIFANLVQLRLRKGAEYAGGEDMAGWLATFAGRPFTNAWPVRSVIQAQSVRDPVRALSLVETLLPPDQPIASQHGWNTVADSVAMLIASDPDAGLRWITERRESPYYGPAVYALIAEQGAGMSDEVVQSWVQTVDAQTRQRIEEWRKKQKAAPAGTDLSISGQIRGGAGAPR